MELEKARSRREHRPQGHRRLSVLLPTLDRRPRLGAAIESVLGQGYDDLELVIADDGSTGETRATIEGWRDDPRVVVTENPGSRRTITENWEAALAASSGDYVLLLGDDDVLLPDSLHRIDRLLHDHSGPDCLSFHCYRFAPDGSVAGIHGGRYEEVGLDQDVPLVGGELTAATRAEVVRGFFSFRHRFPLGVMTMVLASRSAIEDLPRGLFRPPFPDFYAVSALMLIAERWVHVPEPLLVVGISPNSVAGHFHRGEQGEALAYLGELDSFPGSLPGNPFVNATCRWLTELKQDFPRELASVEIDRSQYLVRTVWAWYREYSSDAIDRSELMSRLRQLSAADGVRLMRGGLRIRNLAYAASAFRKRRDLEREMLLSSTRPTDARTLEEFVADVGPR